ncbi:5,6-dimethylbenzimidazole synthase [Herbaspirillum sp. alder98]|uniref:5,6-dimethylbenzimidazole synthase n=1 Tax=Herbaspirillum sp. alder98 TaxID=2913096 RepID=UPI001CD8A04A|nr:5,6-dimethylbenzimidazole synthase [Herbaspirillum sp. alder98]MCA1326573.1 5,6-dimethylbenzimidazole synthase [Herbaspirillum sp. alder98]
MNAATHRYAQSEIDAVYRAIRERRDMRHFSDEAVDPALLARLLEAAHAGPSVGFMQPWRFIRISDGALRRAIHALVEQERLLTAQALGEREDEFMKLKVEAVLDCGELLVAALMDKREDHVFGRRTLPAMDLASLACALQNMWLAARAEGLGMGWVSLFDPVALGQLLGMPSGAQAVAVVCLGHVPAFYAEPMLQQQQWAQRRALDELVFDNQWPKETT